MDFIYSLLFCAGAEPAELKACRGDIRKINRRRLNVYLSFVVGIFTVLMVASVQIDMMWKNFPVYLLGAVISGVLSSMLRLKPDKKDRLFTVCMAMFLILAYMSGILIGTVGSPERQATTAVVLLVLMPMLFIMPPIHNICATAIFDALFIVLAFKYKDPNIAKMDLINCLIFGLITMVVSTYIQISLVRSVTTARKLRAAAERDINTGLKNRNSYEKNMYEYPSRVTNSLSCVYIDVNGLHELNNTRGHAEGDRMLQIVADILQKEFGEEDTYRVGGDEFLAFVLDKSHAEMSMRIATFIDKVNDAGYSVAVGTSTHSAGGIDIALLVKLAEQRMYMAKKKHYEDIGEAAR